MTVILQEHSGQYRLTIPREIVELEKLQKGDKFRIVKIQGYLAWSQSWWTTIFLLSDFYFGP
jgi:hypothetical protein